MKTIEELTIFRADLTTLREIYDGSINSDELNEIDAILAWVMSD